MLLKVTILSRGRCLGLPLKSEAAFTEFTYVYFDYLGDLAFILISLAFAVHYIDLIQPLQSIFL